MKGEKHAQAYEAFKRLLKEGYEGIVISNVSPKNIDKEYNIKAEIYWLSEISGKDILHPSRLDFEVTKTITDFLNESEKPVVLLEGFEYLVEVNGFDTCLRWLKLINDLVANRGAILILPIDPNIFNKKEFMLIMQNMRIYEPREIVPVELNYTNVLKHVSQDDIFELQSFLMPKKYIDFSERKPEIKHFFGRTAELNKTLNFLASEAHVIVIKGIAGIGKTALVAKALERYKFEINVFWHRFYNFSTLRTMLAKLSEFLAKAGVERLKNYIAGGKIDIEEIMMILEEELNNVRALLIFDNFERANNEIVDFFSSLKELRTKSKIVVIGRSIAPFYDRRDVVIRKTVVELKLEGLDKESSEKLLNARGIEKDIDRFYNLTKGHPLMLELILPETTAEAEEFLKEEIVRALNNREKKALEIASVLRVPFYARALLVEDIEYDVIDALVEKSLLQRSYNIYNLHEMLREFFYTRLTSKQKSYYHILAAQYYEKEIGDSALIETMYHYLSANEQERAIELAVENSSTIIKGGLLEEFRTILTEFKTEKIQKQQYAKILLSKGDISNLLGKWDEALNYYHSALELSTEIKEDAYSAESYRGIAKIYFRRGEYDKTLRNLQNALEISERINDVHGIADVHYNIGSVYLRKGEVGEAMKELELCLRFCERISDLALTAKTYGAIGIAYWSVGEYNRSIELMEKALGEVEKLGDKHELVKIYNNLGTAYDGKGDIDRAIEWYEKCVKLSNEIGDARTLGYGLSNAAQGYIEKSELARAGEYTANALKIFERLGEKRAIAQCELNYGIIHKVEKEWSKAVESFEKAIKLAKEIQDSEFPSQIYFEYGKMYKEKGEKEKARELFRNAITAYEKLGNIKKVEELNKELQEL
ncbi:MAG: tetratricopeptide repeat protein [Candidatus Thermoplasmatota archaeon]|nr:tetratricopeptide repeat protein [Candidatus Thermoplasmatota archaeon]